VTLAAYGSLEVATADWDDLEWCPVNQSNTIDAVLIEREGDRVATLHGFSMRGWGYGWIASAVVGALWPPALLAGAVAGGVGANVITCVSRGFGHFAASRQPGVADGQAADGRNHVAVARSTRA
jgi:hypothetical protein